MKLNLKNFHSFLKMAVYLWIWIGFHSMPAFGQEQPGPYLKDTSLSAENIHPDLQSEYSEEMSDDFSPGLALFALIGLIFILICLGAGMVLTALISLAIFGMIGAGILSASLMVGLYKKSFTRGFKTFFISTTSMLGTFAGTGGFWFINKITHWWNMKTAVITGAISGFIAGLLLGFLMFYLLRKLCAFLLARLKKV